PIGSGSRLRGSPMQQHDHYISTIIQKSNPISKPPRYRSPRFGANGLHPGRRSEPSPIQPDEVATAMAFLQMFRPTQRAYVSSYSLKHAAENWGRTVGLRAYVSNGALILAALMLGLAVRPSNGWLNPNAAIGTSKRD